MPYLLYLEAGEKSRKASSLRFTFLQSCKKSRTYTGRGVHAGADNAVQSKNFQTTSSVSRSRAELSLHA